MSPEEQIAIIRQSGLFDREWYLTRNPDVAAAKVEPLEHWFFNSPLEKRDPNFLFSIGHYLSQNQDVNFEQINPLVHYTLAGEREGRRPSPYFDPVWFGSQYHVPLESPHETLLGYYLKRTREATYSPHEYFDTKFYLSHNPDVAGSGVAPYEHFITTGAFEGRDPCANFRVRYYIRRHRVPSDMNALLYHITSGAKLRLPTTPEQEPSIHTEFAFWTSPGPHFKSGIEASWDMEVPNLVDVFAFYLPQFHAVKINDEAWGTGFTEWRNISRGLPRFHGHYQPRIPRDLGFYDLTNPEVIERQVQLAKEAGLSGFAFYYYHFDQGRVLDKPIELFMKSTLDFQFFLIWANENWTKTWDGLEEDVILAQTYTEASLEAQSADVARHMMDGRYYRIKGRPVFVVYRPGSIPNAKEYLHGLRKKIHGRVGATPFMMMAQGFGDEDPRPFGLDGAIEFPPHKIGQNQPSLNDALTFYDQAYEGIVQDYGALVEGSLKEKSRPFHLIKTVFPSWDNEARRPGHGLVIHGSTPERYGRWLSGCIDFARQNKIEGNSIVAINAWNEWCEGAYLEPDVHYGFAYLTETSRAILRSRKLPLRECILLVGHDAHAHGAQLLLLSIAIQLKHFGFRVAVLLLEGGQLEDRYRNISDVFMIARGNSAITRALASNELGICKFAITNTVVAGEAVPELRRRGMSVISLVHEMQHTIRERRLESLCSNIAKYSNKVIFPAKSVADDFVAVTSQADFTHLNLPQGIYNKPTRPLSLGKSDNSSRVPVIVNVGFGDLRKGYDIFVSTANYFHECNLPGHFVWVGNVKLGIETWIEQAATNFTRIPFTEHIYDILAMADVMFLSSREDPFPSVALEALGVGIPVVSFAGTGGIADLIGSYPLLGAVVPKYSVTSTAHALVEQIRVNNVGKREQRSNLMMKHFDFPVYVGKLVGELGITQTKVTAIVPNYNYAKFLRDRLETVFRQNLPPTQIFLIDDCSTDGSQEVISDLSRSLMPWLTTRYNIVNSGSPFTQWWRGAAMAAGDYIWIAEADDRAEPDFLMNMISFMEEYDCSIAFCDSRQIDWSGTILSDSYSYYFDTVDSELFENSFVMDGDQFLVRALSQKNLILNVSSVVWRKSVLLDALESLKDELSQFRVAGDWRIYAQVASRPSAQIGYIKSSLNTHRRHPASATHSQARGRQLDEIKRMHKTIRSLTKQGPGSAMARSQQEYISELMEQFGLTDGAD